MKLGILGTGNMAEALIAGLIAQKVLPASKISGFDVNRERLRFISKRYRIQTFDSALKVIKASNVLLLAVKPQQIPELLNEVLGHLTSKHLLLSIAAGIDVRTLEKLTHKGQRLVRAMPNTPALVGLGATAFYPSRSCTRADRSLARKLFGAVGCAFEVKKESLLDAVTGLSGSGPAYVFSFIKALTEGGVQAGLPADLAGTLAVQTVIGAGNLLRQSSETPEALIAKVASKGGTTEAGLKVLKKLGFENTIARTVAAATERAKQLRSG